MAATPSGEQFELRFGEQHAVVTEVGAGLRAYSAGGRELLDALVAEKPDIKRYHSPEEIETTGLGRLTEAVTLLEQKATPDEAEAYRKFALAVAERVAEAHKEGGEQVSEAERAAIEKVSASLYASPSA